MGKIYVVASGKGGVGKSTATANIGTALAMKDKKVLLIDADIGLRNLDILLGTDDKVVYDFVDVIDKKCRLDKAIIKDKRYKCLHFLAASQTKGKGDITAEQMKKLCDELRHLYDFIFIDCPAGIEHGFEIAASAADEAIIVTVPERTALRDADKVVMEIDKLKTQNKWLLINRVRPRLLRRRNIPSVSDIIEMLAVNLIGAVPEDESVIISSAEGKTVVECKKSRAKKAYFNIAERLLGNKVPLMFGGRGEIV